MAQPSVTSFFNSRKRQATDEIRNKAKVRVVDSQSRIRQNCIKAESESDESRPLTPQPEEDGNCDSPKIVFSEGSDAKNSSVVRNLQFEGKASATGRMTPKSARSRQRVRKFSVQEGQADIRETFLKMAGEGGKEGKTVLFEKKGALSPRKKCPTTPTKRSEVTENAMPKQSFMDRLAKQDLTIGEIKNRINKSSRLAELKASIAKIRGCQDKLDKLEREGQAKKPQIKKFENIQLEVPISPSKAARSPSKLLLSPAKNIKLPESASPQRRLLFAPKETPASPVKSPTKVPAYQRYQTLVDSGTAALPLPYNYRFLAEAFRCVDTVAGMLFNRKEVITFRKLKPAVQELLRRNFTMEHLAQIKAIYPEAFSYNQEKIRNFGSTSKQDKYELVLVPQVDMKGGSNTPDPDNVLKSASEMSMGPGVMLERRRKFYNVLLDKVKTEHEKFLHSLESPMNIPKERITRWHPEFDVESCANIEPAELPQPPNVEKAQSAMQVLQKAKTLFNCDTRMGKALQRLADANMTSKSVAEEIPTSAETQQTEEKIGEPRKVEITVVDTPPATPTTQKTQINSALKGIPKALLERVRAKQAAKALEAMTRTPTADKEAAIYSRLPDMAKIVRNIFVAEKKGVLPLETVITKLDNSYRTKLTPNELEEHLRLMCKLLPTFSCLQQVRHVDYLKIAKTADIVKIIKRLEILANEKIKA